MRCTQGKLVTRRPTASTIRCMRTKNRMLQVGGLNAESSDVRWYSSQLMPLH
jgi:hypothetical protein